MKKQTTRRLIAVILTLAMILSMPMFSLAATYPEPKDLPVYDEFLPDPFQFYDGSMVRTTADWPARAAEIKDLAAFYEYGYYPPRAEQVVTAVMNSRTSITITVTNTRNSVTRSFNANLAYPNAAAAANIPGPWPVVISTGTSAPTNASSLNTAGYVTANATGTTIVADSGAGNYAFANAYTGLFYELYPNAEYDAGNYIGWAWTASTILDALYYLQAHPNPDIPFEIAPTKAAVTGGSRNGKAALAAGLFDDRFGVVNPSHSGSGGTGVYRYVFDRKNYPWYDGVIKASEAGLFTLPANFEWMRLGEMMRDLQQRYPWWGNSNYNEFTKDYSAAKYLPYDHHELIAAIAPRGVFSNVGYADYWLNHEGMYVAYYEAKQVYKWLGCEENLAFVTYPANHAALPATHVSHFIDFLDQTFGRKTPANIEVLPAPAASGVFSFWTSAQLDNFNAYKPDPSWHTTRPLGSPDEVVGLKSVKYIVDGLYAYIPATVKAINNAKKKVLASLLVNGQIVETKEVIFTGNNGHAKFSMMMIDDANTYAVTSYFEGDQPALSVTVPVIPDHKNWWNARVGQRYNGTAAAGPSTVNGSGLYLVEFSNHEDSWDILQTNWTRAELIDSYKITLNGVNAKAVIRDQEGPYKCCFTLVPDELLPGSDDQGNLPIGAPLNVIVKGVKFPELFPSYSFTFTINGTNERILQHSSSHSQWIDFDEEG